MKYELKNQIMWKWKVLLLYNPVYWKVKDRPEGQIIFWNYSCEDNSVLQKSER